MFRRRWSGLPADPVFQPDFKELGYVLFSTRSSFWLSYIRAELTCCRYFINEIDEIRSIENPDYYFKYFLSKNERWNERQRFAFNCEFPSPTNRDQSIT